LTKGESVHPLKLDKVAYSVGDLSRKFYELKRACWLQWKNNCCRIMRALDGAFKIKIMGFLGKTSSA